MESPALVNSDLSQISDDASHATSVAAPPDHDDLDADMAQEVPQGFTISNEQSANWLVRKVVAARLYRTKVKKWSEHEVLRAQREEATLMFLFRRQLKVWTHWEIAKRGGRRKSIELPAGAVGYRRSPTKLVIDDDAAVLQWARLNCPQAVVVEERLSKSTLTEHLAESGEVPPEGAHIESAVERFFIR